MNIVCLVTQPVSTQRQANIELLRQTNKHVGLCQTPKHPNKATRQRNRGVVRERRGDNIWVKARQGPIFSWDHSTSHKPGTSSEPQSTKAARQRKLITTKRIGGAVGHGHTAPHSGPLSPLTQLCVTRVDLAKPFLRRSLCRVARSTPPHTAFLFRAGLVPKTRPANHAEIYGRATPRTLPPRTNVQNVRGNAACGAICNFLHFVCAPRLSCLRVALM